MHTPRKRNKNGLAYHSPIALRLMPEEREQVVVLAKKSGKTMSAFARDAYLAGLPLVTIPSSHAAADTSAATSGGSCILGAASFSSESMGE